MPLRGMTDGLGNAFIDPTTGFMLVFDTDQQIRASFAAQGAFAAFLFKPSSLLAIGAAFAASGRLDANLTRIKSTAPTRIITQPGYEPVNAFLRRTIVRKRR